MDSLKVENQQDDGGCGPGCGCDAPRRSRRLKVVVTVAVVLVATGVLANRLQGRGAPTTQGSDSALAALLPSGAAAPVGDQAAAIPALGESDVPLWGGSLSSIVDLNRGEQKYDAVFVFLPAAESVGSPAIRSQIEGVERAVRGQGRQIQAFTLERDTAQYRQLTQAFPAPCVLAMVRGASAAMIAGDITEASLMQGYVQASRPRSACCPTGGDKSKCAAP